MRWLSFSIFALLLSPIAQDSYAATKYKVVGCGTLLAGLAIVFFVPVGVSPEEVKSVMPSAPAETKKSPPFEVSSSLFNQPQTHTATWDLTKAEDLKNQLVELGKEFRQNKDTAQVHAKGVEIFEMKILPDLSASFFSFISADVPSGKGRFKNRGLLIQPLIATIDFTKALHELDGDQKAIFDIFDKNIQPLFIEIDDAISMREPALANESLRRVQILWNSQYKMSGAISLPPWVERDPFYSRPDIKAQIRAIIKRPYWEVPFYLYEK